MPDPTRAPDAPGKLLRPQYVIINDIDAPEPAMVCQWVPGVGYCYLDRSRSKPSHDGMRGAEATDIREFGLVYTNNKDGTVSFYRTDNPTTAKYHDGEPRRWQSRTSGFERTRLTAASLRAPDAREDELRTILQRVMNTLATGEANEGACYRAAKMLQGRIASLRARAAGA